MPIGSSDRINVGVLVERASGERRVALIPADIKKLTSKVTFVIESGAGREAGFDDNTYVDAGARIANLREILGSCDVVVKIRPPAVDEMPPASRILVSLGGHDPNLGESLRKLISSLAAKVSSISSRAHRRPSGMSRA
jgi:NAD(P) transhydrogenase subunit alpha